MEAEIQEDDGAWFGAVFRSEPLFPTWHRLFFSLPHKIPLFQLLVPEVGTGTLVIKVKPVFYLHCNIPSVVIPLQIDCILLRSFVETLLPLSHKGSRERGLPSTHCNHSSFTYRWGSTETGRGCHFIRIIHAEHVLDRH